MPFKALLFRLAAVASAAATAFLVLRYPLGWAAPTLVLSAYAAVLWYRPHWWIYALLGLLPVLNLYPWTGWLFVEEFDLAVLVTLTMGYLRAPAARPRHRFFPPLGTIAVIALTLSYLASTLIALRGMPPFTWEALATYNTPVNAIRVLKGWAWAVLLLPLLRRAADAYGGDFPRVIAHAMLGGLAAVSLVVLWERNAFPGLMNFSSDYRAIGPFFEAHVGGAALDGFLALVLPFAIAAVLLARSPRAMAAGAALLLIGTYASFATFSRGLYLAIAVAVVLITGLVILRQVNGPGRSFQLTVGLVAVLAGAFLLMQVFASGGYRTLAAAAGAYAAAVYVGGIVAPLAWRRTLTLLAALSVITLLFLLLVPKGAYLIYGASALALGAAAALERSGRSISPDWILAACGWVAINCAAVGLHWGGSQAAVDAGVAVGVAVALALYNRAAMLPLWALSWRTAGIGVAGGLLVAIAIPVVGNYYMKTRIHTVAHDLQAREDHWRGSVEMRGSDVLSSVFGAGLGTYPQRFFWHNHKGDFPGVVAVLSETGQNFVRLGQPRPTARRSVEPLRFSQRIAIEPGQTLTLTLSARSTTPKARLNVNVCEKWLLYTERCGKKRSNFVPKPPGEWRTYTAELSTVGLGSTFWWGKRSALLSMSVDGTGTVVDVRDIALIDGSGRNLVENGKFVSGGDHWYFTSDHAHLPWHAKNLWLGIWFDQGWFGLAGFVLLLAAVLAYPARTMDPYGVARLAGIAAFLTVGLFDTLLDATRIAALFYLLSFSSMLQDRGSRKTASAAR